MMSAILAQQMQQWPEVETYVINACYADQRGDLGGFSLRKIIRWISYLLRTLWYCLTRNIGTIVMTHSFFRGPFLKDSAFLWLGSLLRKRLIVWVHMDPNRLGLDQSSKLFKWYARKVLQLPDRWVACAPRLPQTWPQEFDRAKITPIFNAIEDEESNLSKVVSSSVRVTFLSAMTDEKGWKDLFSVAQAICREHDDVVFGFYGGPGAGETNETIRSAFECSEFPHRITWHGAVDKLQKRQMFSVTDIFCLPSWTEAFPLVVLEAMAQGIPVIASNVGGIPDAVAHATNGWLFPARDRVALENVLIEAINHPELLKCIGEKNRNDFVQKFTLAGFDRNWKNLLAAE